MRADLVAIECFLLVILAVKCLVLGMRLSPWLTQTVKTLFAVRWKSIDRQSHFIAFWSRSVKRRRALLESNPPRN